MVARWTNLSSVTHGHFSMTFYEEIKGVPLRSVQLYHYILLPNINDNNKLWPN